ncbi:MAG: PqqD family protein [Planctomycetota bacterium]|jgi:hypothetical protein
MGISSDTTFKTSENIAWRNVNEEVVILHLKSGEYFTLNDVGQFIWLAVADQKNMGEIRQKVVDAFDISPEKASEDIDEFISRMLDEGLLHKSV